MLAKIKGFKTILFNVVMTAIMCIRLWRPDAELPDEVAVVGAVDALDAALTAVWGVGNLILRSITDSAIFKTEGGGSQANSPALVGLLAVILAALAISGCAGTSAAYKAADGLSQTSYVVGEHYFALVRQANTLRDSGNLTANQVHNLQEIAVETRPSVVALLDAAHAYESVQSSLNEANLSDALTVAAVAISRLIDAIKTATSTSYLIEPQTAPTVALLSHNRSIYHAI